MSSQDKQQEAIALLKEKGFVSLVKFADIIRVSYMTALKMRDRGDVITTHIGGVYRVYAHEVYRFLEQGNANRTEGHALLTHLIRTHAIPLPPFDPHGGGEGPDTSSSSPSSVLFNPDDLRSKPDDE